MKEKIHFKKIAFLFLFTAIFGYSQDKNYSAFSIPSELKENANVVFRNNAIEITIEAVDRMVVKTRNVITVLNKLGNVDAQIYQHYDDDTKITKLSAKIYDAFGKEIKKYNKGKFIDVSAVDGGTLYSDARVKYIDHTPIGYPYTLVFESEYKTSSTGFIPRWFPTEGYFVGIEKSTYKLNNPLQIPIRTKENNFTEYPIENLSTDGNLYYVFKNQPAIEPENQSISSREFMPYLLVASNDFALKQVKGMASDWKQFGKWMHDKLLRGRDALDMATKQKIQNLVNGVADPIEKAKIVYRFMQEKTRYISVQVGIGGWEPILATEVDKVGYGDCKGLTNYTKALLDAVGVESYYSVVYAKQKRNIDKDFASLQGNHVILNIPNEGEDVWLECTSQIMPFGFLGDFTDDRDVLVVTPEGGVIKRTPAYLNDTNLQTTKATIQLDEKGTINASLTRDSKGIQYDDKFGYETFSEEDLIKHYKSKVWSYNNNLEVNSVSLMNYKDAVVFSEELDISIEDYASLNQGEYLFRVNVFNRINHVPKRYRNRKLPLKISRGYKDIDAYTITIPEGFSIGILPPKKEITTEFGSYTLHIEKVDETTIAYKRTILIKAGEHPKEKYNAYRKFRKKIAKLENLRIGLLKK